MKLPAILFFIVLVLILGIVGHYERQHELWDQTVKECEAETSLCFPLIKEVQKDPHAEVIMDGNGHTWIEQK